MKLFLSLFLLLTTLEAAPISWQHNYQKALTKAQSEAKPLMVYLYLPNCMTCRYMEKNVFSDREVADYIAGHYVAVKFYPNDKGLPKKLQSEMSPVLHFLNPQNAEVIDTIMGGKNAEKFLELLEESYATYKEGK